MGLFGPLLVLGRRVKSRDGVALGRVFAAVGRRAHLIDEFALMAVLVAVVCGCARDQEPRQPAQSRIIDGLVTLVPHRTPAEWRSYPRAVLPGLSEIDVGGRALLLDRLGHRWVRSVDGRVSGSPSVAPEVLVGAGAATSGFWFMGESGATYRASSLLGQLVALKDPPKPFVRVASSSGGLLGVTDHAQLFTSYDHGDSWTQALPGETVVDVGLLPTGAGLALLSPERFMTTSDFGRNWRPLELEPLGATHVLEGAKQLGLLTLLGRFAWAPNKPLGQPESATGTTAEDLVVSEVHASADALAKRAAVLNGRDYSEVEGTESSLALWRGDVEKPLRRIETTVRKCRRPQLFAGAHVSYLLCFSDTDRVARIKLLKSEDGGKTFEEQSTRLHGAVAHVRGVVWREELVLTGICAPDGELDGCVAKGLFMIPRYSLKDSKVKRLALPLLSGNALGLSVAPSTQRLWVAGAHRKGGKATLFSATSADASFGVTMLPNLDVGLRRGEPLLEVTPGAWSQEGYGSFTFQSAAGNARVLVVVDEKGGLVQTATGPNARAAVASVGLRAIAVDGRVNKVWESIDGGATWLEAPSPPGGFCKSEDTTCDVALTCYDGGCLASERWLRLGWGGAAPVTKGSEAVVEAPKNLPTPIVCKIADDATWKSVAGGELPDAARASLNGVDWFAHDVDWTSAALTAYEMPFSASGGAQSAKSEGLFEARSDANQWVVYATHQTEGVAGLRARANGDVVDVAWRNLFTGHTTHRAKLKDAGTLASNPTRFSTRAGQPGFVSIAQGGVFVRLTQEEGGARTYFIRENGSVQTLDAVNWPSTMAAGRTEMATIDDAPVALKLFRGGTVVARARLEEGAWKIDAMSVGLDERVFDVKQSFELTYGARSPQYYIWQQSPEELRGMLFPMQLNGAVLGGRTPAPTQQDVNRTLEPTVCTAQAASASPRIITPAQKGVRYPVVVEHSSEPLRAFLTNLAVVHGSVENACVAVFDGEALFKVQGEEHAVLVRPEPDRASWLFRRVSGTTAFDYRPMTCRYDAQASVPNEVVERARARL